MTVAFADREIAAALRGLASRRAAPRRLDEVLAGHLVSRGLAANDAGGALRLTDVGAAWLRRHIAGGEDFAAQHQTRVAATVDHETFGRYGVTINQDEGPLAWLRRHKGRDGRPLVDAAEFTAGERLRSDYTRGRIMPRVTAN